MEKEVKQYLIDHPKARLAQFKNQAVWNFARRKYGFEVIDADFFYKHGHQIDTVRWYIDKIQRENVELQGADYPKKKERIQKNLVDKGYEVGYYQLTS